MSEIAAAHFRLWLRAGLSGCEFAKLLAGKANRVAIELHIEDQPPRSAWLNTAFDANGTHGDRGLFPRIVSELGLVQFLNELESDERWSVLRRKSVSPDGNVLVGLEWTTQTKDASETMGFAPFGTMPVTRRAPYVAIATWPGARSNPFRGQGLTPPGRPNEVSFLDAKHGFELPEYEQHWKETSNAVAGLMAMPPDDPKLYRRAAFVLSPSSAQALKVSTR